jgi:hypothetical protein
MNLLFILLSMNSASASTARPAPRPFPVAIECQHKRIQPLGCTMTFEACKNSPKYKCFVERDCRWECEGGKYLFVTREKGNGK